MFVPTGCLDSMGHLEIFVFNLYGKLKLGTTRLPMQIRCLGRPFISSITDHYGHIRHLIGFRQESFFVQQTEYRFSFITIRPTVNNLTTLPCRLGGRSFKAIGGVLGFDDI